MRRVVVSTLWKLLHKWVGRELSSQNARQSQVLYETSRPRSTPKCYNFLRVAVYNRSTIYIYGALTSL